MKNPVSQSEIEAYWGPESLTRWAASDLRDVLISPASKKFLIGVGLPSPGRDIHGWEFEWDPGLPYFDQTQGLRSLGWNRRFHPVLIDEKNGGCVVWDARPDGFERYINASVEQFAASLMVLDENYQRVLSTLDQPYDVANARHRLAALERRLNEIDESALADPDSLWCTIINDMRRELA
jgi:hypothetical protein